jgi:hypothetical protein
MGLGWEQGNRKTRTSSPGSLPPSKTPQIMKRMGQKASKPAYIELLTKKEIVSQVTAPTRKKPTKAQTYFVFL